MAVRSSPPRAYRALEPLLELGLVIAFAAWVCWDYLGGTKSSFIPDGNDYLVSIQGRFFWDRVQECGACAFWNGDIAGGSPALIDASSDFLHPLAIPALLLQGALDGSRTVLFLAVALSGVSSWWLARVLSTSVIARLYAGALGVVGGHITGRLDFGLVVLITAIATASLFLPCAIAFGRRPDRRRTALLGAVLGLTIVAGQGYIQIAVLVLAPAILILLVGRHGWRRFLVRLGEVGAIGGLLAAPLLLPFWQYRHLIDKDADASFARVQSFAQVPLNLVISAPAYFDSAVFRSPGFPAWHVNYIGWIALGFAVAGAFRLWRSSWRECAFLLTVALGALWLGSGQLFESMARFSPIDGLSAFAIRLRTPSNMANLAVPAILGLSACGVDAARDFLMSRMPRRLQSWPRGFNVSFATLLVMLPLVWSVRDVEQSARTWMHLIDLDDGGWTAVVDAVPSEELGWIEGRPLYNAFALVALDDGKKLGNGWAPWRIDPRILPAPAFLVSSEETPADSTPLATVDEFTIFSPNVGNRYATLALPTGHETMCAATGRGGEIAVACPAAASGLLTIQERWVEGWSAHVDGQPAGIVNAGGWIAVPLESGNAHIDLRYHPPHLGASLVLAALGAGWASWWILAPSRGSRRRPQQDAIAGLRADDI